MPGALTVTNDLSVGGDAYIGKDKNFILDGDNKWIFHTPDDGRKILYLAPWNGKDNWDWSKQFTIDNNGNVNVNGGITTGAITSNDWFRVKGPNGLYFETFGGGWHMADTTWVRSYNGKSVYCNQEIRANRMTTEGDITAAGAVKAASFCIGGTCIDETHLQMLTGARAMNFYHTEGAHVHGSHRYIHVDSGRHLVTWESSPSYFKLNKQ
jgi:hypothetical protein